MGRRKDRARTPGLWIATTELPVTGGHPFYQRLNQILDTHAFDACVEAQGAPFYAATVGRPSLTPGTYFRLLLIGYFEGIDSERGIAWRTADSLALRGFLGLGLEEPPPEHSTISRTRRLIDLETPRAVFTWILQVLATADLVQGTTIGIDATTLEATAALRSIVRHDSGETYQACLTRLAQASGIATPTRADVARLDRKRSKKGRNTDWRHPHDPDARLTTMKDGRTHLAHTAEHAVDLETGAIGGVTVQGADQGDTTTIAATVTTAADALEAVATVTDEATAVIDEVVAAKGYHRNQTLVDLAQLDVRTYIAEPNRGRRRWQHKAAARAAVHANRRRIRGRRGGAPCSGAVASDWNDRMRISMTPAGCAGRICAATTTSANDCWSTRVASTWAFSGGRWSVWARREGSRGGLRPSWPSSWRSGRSHTPCGVTERRRPPINRHRWCPVTVSSRGRSPHWKHPLSHGLLGVLSFGAIRRQAPCS